MRGLAKILIAVDVGIAALVGGMKLYLDSGVIAPDETPAPHAARPVEAVAASPPAATGAGWDQVPMETWLLIGLGATIVLCLILWVAIGIYERRAHADVGDFAADLPPEADPEPIAAAPPREAPSVFRAAAQRSDQPVFGRAVRRTESA